MNAAAADQAMLRSTRLFRSLAVGAALLALAPAVAMPTATNAKRTSASSLSVAVQRFLPAAGGQSVAAIAPRPGGLWVLRESATQSSALAVNWDGSVASSTLLGTDARVGPVATGPDGSFWVFSNPSGFQVGAAGICPCTQLLRVMPGGQLAATNVAKNVLSPDALVVTSTGNAWVTGMLFGGYWLAASIDPASGQLATLGGVGQFFGTGLVEAPGGDIWLDPDKPTAELEAIDPTTRQVVGQVTLPGRAVDPAGLAIDSHGVVWAAARGYAARYDGRSLRTYQPPRRGCENLMSIVPDSGGALYVGLDHCARLGTEIGWVAPSGQLKQAIVNTGASYLDVRSRPVLEKPGTFWMPCGGSLCRISKR